MAVSFCRTKTRAEALDSPDLDCVYFPTDSSTIIMGGKEYASSSKTEKLTLSEYKQKVAAGTIDLDTFYLITNVNEDDEALSIL